SGGEMQDFTPYPIPEIWETIQQKQSGEETEELKDLKTPEWKFLSAADPQQNTSDFQLRRVDSPQNYTDYFKQIVLVERLREVRALIGFTRLQSPGDFTDLDEIPEKYWVNLSRNLPSWVPATEVKGEGIFIEFNEELIQKWEKKEKVKTRENFTREAYNYWLNSRNLDPEKAKFSGMRYVLIHSFAHALMRQLAIECGYNAASLRERIYSQLPTDDNGPQAGVLIYTASADSEGTLGGLVNLGEPATFGYHVTQALEQMRLCASDPLCAEHQPEEGNPALHWAACHACLFSPETSCERGNKFLDRSLLVATVQEKELAFFDRKQS
ncbi:MAG: DrmB family protein, partial [Chroococcales cyanobacterium]